MLDALRQHKPPPQNPDAPSRPGASDENVLASLGYPSDRERRPDSFSSGQRLGLAIVLVLVTGMLLWQVGAMNGLLPSGPFSMFFQGSAARRPPPPVATGAEPSLRPPLAAPPVSSAPGEPTMADAARSPGAAAPGTAALAQGADTAASRLPVVEAPKPVLSPRADGVKAPSSTPADASTSPAAQMPVTTRRGSRVPPSVQVPSTAAGAAAAARSGAAVAPAVSRAPIGDVDHFKLALYYQRIGDFENALVHYRALLAANELNAEAHNNLGLLYQTKGLYEEAIREFQRATFIDPRYTKAHNNLGVALLRSGQTDASAAEFRGVVAQDPKNVEALTNLSLALKASGRAEEARETLQRALSINGRYAQAHYNLALLYDERGELQRAIDHYEQFLATSGPDSASLTVEVRARVQTLRGKLM